MRSQLQEALEWAIEAANARGIEEGPDRWQEVLDASRRIEPGDLLHSEFESGRIAEALSKPTNLLRAAAGDVGDGMGLTADQVIWLCEGLFQGLSKYLSARVPEEVPGGHDGPTSLGR